MSTTEKVITKFIADEILNTPEDSLPPDRLLLEEGLLDSMALQQLVTFLEEELAVRIEEEHLTPENFESVSALATFADANRA